MGALRVLTPTQRLTRGCNDCTTGVTENGIEAARGEARRSVQSGTGIGRGWCVGVKRRHVSKSGQKTGQPIVRGECVILGVAVPTAGAGAAKGIVSGRQETRESEGASGAIDEGLGVCGWSFCRSNPYTHYCTVKLFCLTT
jgi:hypothetical protein